MLNRFTRTELLIGKDALDILKEARVAVFGLGGVGGYVVEALTRAGVGNLDLIDNDTVSLTNINRQIIALEPDIGKQKTEVFRRRCLDINPDVCVRTYDTFYLPETADQFDFREYDAIADCIDTVSGKISIIVKAYEAGTPVISSMGTGNRLDPSKVIATDVYKTSGDPLAKVMRKELKKRGIPSCRVVCSTELPITPDPVLEEEILKGEEHRRSIPGSSPFVPPAAGLLIAYEIVKILLKD